MARAGWSVGQWLPSACCDLVWTLVAEFGSVSCVQWRAFAFRFRWIQVVDRSPAVFSFVGCGECFVPAAVPYGLCKFRIVGLEVAGYFLGQFA